jgi:hypothetical protein
VDPWQRALAAQAPRSDSGWFDRPERAPVARAVVAPWLPSSGQGIADPWAPRPRVAPAGPVPPALSPFPEPAPKATPRPLHASNWARVLPEIIDPWGPRSAVAYRDPLIVDPWRN